MNVCMGSLLGLVLHFKARAYGILVVANFDKGNRFFLLAEMTGHSS